MKSEARVWWIVLWVIALPLFCIGGCYSSWQYKQWKFSRLEKRIRRVITAEELQTWATSILAEFPNYSSGQYEQLQTNSPAKVRSVSTWIEREPVIRVVEDERTPFVVMTWSLTPWGDAIFEVGSTNFESRSTRARAWAPGVYFWRK